MLISELKDRNFKVHLNELFDMSKYYHNKKIVSIFPL